MMPRSLRTLSSVCCSRLKLMNRSHFPGSCILYWDRLQEPPPAELPTKPVPVSGIIFTADTIMVQPTQTKFTFIWSAPNMVSRPESCHVERHTSLTTSVKLQSSRDSYEIRFI